MIRFGLSKRLGFGRFQNSPCPSRQTRIYLQRTAQFSGRRSVTGVLLQERPAKREAVRIKKVAPKAARPVREEKVDV